MLTRCDRGFSIIDIMLACALLAVLAGLAIPSFQDSLRSYRLADAANELASELNAARVLAVSRGTSYRVNFDTDRNSFQIVDLSDPENPTRRERALGSSLRVASAPSPPIVFTSRGVARAGTVVFSNDKDERIAIEVTASGQTIVHKMSQGYETYTLQP